MMNAAAIPSHAALPLGALISMETSYRIELAKRWGITTNPAWRLFVYDGVLPR